MGQVIIPSSNKIEGPWLLDRKSLEELDNCLKRIDEKLSKAYDLYLNIIAESKVKEYADMGNIIDIENAKIKVKESYEFKDSEKYISIKTKQGKIIKYDDLLSFLKSNQIDEFNPIELFIKIKKGPFEIVLELSTQYEGNLKTRIIIFDNDVFNDVFYEINKWIDDHKPSIHLQKWSSWFPLASVFILIFVLILIPYIIKDKIEIYKSQLKKEASYMLKDGLDDKEAKNAIELILKYESGYVPETFNPSFIINSTLGWTCLFLLCLLVLNIKPNSVIGIGKNKLKFKFYRFWINFILFFIPSTIAIPIIINLIT